MWFRKNKSIFDEKVNQDQAAAVLSVADDRRDVEVGKLIEEIGKLRGQLSTLSKEQYVKERVIASTLYNEKFENVSLVNLDRGVLPQGLSTIEGVVIKAKSLSESNRQLVEQVEAHRHLANNLRATVADMRANVYALTEGNKKLVERLNKRANKPAKKTAKK